MAVRNAVMAACPGDAALLPAALPRIRAAVLRIAPGTADIRPWAPEGRAARPTLYVTLGEGKGHNWWGVLYDGALGMAGAEQEADTEEVVFVWPWWDWLMHLLGF